MSQPLVLFINPPSRQRVYDRTYVGSARPEYPNLTLATLAGGLVGKCQVRLLELDLVKDPESALKSALTSLRPQVAAMSLMTVNAVAARETAGLIRQYSPETMIAVGGVHVTSCPFEFNDPELYDLAVLGEADGVLEEVLNGAIQPNAFRTPADEETINAALRYMRRRPKSELPNPDDLPYPYWKMFDLSFYRHSHLTARANPVGLIETARGCPFNCNFCNKNIFGHHFRPKSPARVVDEFFYMKEAGFKEIHIADDAFTQDLDRAKEICQRLIDRKFDLPWSMYNGIRVDHCDREFFQLCRRAGGWSVSFGIESGNQAVLDRVHKGTDLAMIERAVRLANKEGLNTFGFFILGLPGETEESLKDTIKFSRKLPLSIAKFGICVPLPGTRLWDEWESEGRILMDDWSMASFHHHQIPLYNHENLSWETLRKYYSKAYHSFYLNPRYIARHFVQSVRRGDLGRDISLLAKTVASIIHPN